MLPRQLLQEVSAYAERMLASYQRQRVLISPIVGEPELRNVGGAAEAGYAQPGIVGNRGVERIRGRQREIKTDASVVKPELIGYARRDHVSVAEQPVHRPAHKIIVESRQVIQRWPDNRTVIQPAEAQVLLV